MTAFADKVLIYVAANEAAQMALAEVCHWGAMVSEAFWFAQCNGDAQISAAMRSADACMMTLALEATNPMVRQQASH